MNRVGAVVIGRNEEPKLRRCLSALLGFASPIVFVDSASADRSVELARGMGVEVVELAGSVGWTVARARNAGLARLVELAPDVELIQFVDADSEMIPSWFAGASRVLDENAALAVVFGRVRERYPHRSLYTRLYQTEFDAQVSQPEACGGMAMMRVRALRQVDGFNPALFGFEDYELSFRLRRAGWRVQRLDVDMVVHEAGMVRAAQWWQRQIRGGYARAHEAALHGHSPERYRVRERRSIWFWGGVLPVLAFVPMISTRGASLLLLGGYPVLLVRIYWRTRGRGATVADAALYAASCVLGKFPQIVGQTRFYTEHHLRAWARPRPGRQ